MERIERKEGNDDDLESKDGMEGTQEEEADDTGDDDEANSSTEHIVHSVS